MGTVTRMSRTGQVIIPPDVREVLGLEAGDDEIVFERNAAGEVVIRKAHTEDASISSRVAEIRAISQQFAHLREGRPTDEIMRELRGDEPFPP